MKKACYKINSNSYRRWILTGILVLLFIFSVEYFTVIEKWLLLFIKPKNIFVERISLQEAATQHIVIVAISSFFSVLIAMMIAISTKFKFMSEFRDFFLSAATFGQTVPTVALLAILVPFLGYGYKPILIALFIYGILPVLRNAIEGFDLTSNDIREAANGMGMSKLQILARVEMPLALPAIIAGIKISTILNISVATIGATVGVKGFGTLIVNGIRGSDTIMLLKGAIPVSLLAIATESLFTSLEKSITPDMTYRE
jgi:osmoprotectant transport system permease protein